MDRWWVQPGLQVVGLWLLLRLARRSGPSNPTDDPEAHLGHSNLWAAGQRLDLRVYLSASSELSRFNGTERLVWHQTGLRYRADDPPRALQIQIPVRTWRELQRAGAVPSEAAHPAPVRTRLLQPHGTRPETGCEPISRATRPTRSRRDSTRTPPQLYHCRWSGHHRVPADRSRGGI